MMKIKQEERLRGREEERKKIEVKKVRG